jgi:hypothetical protein
MMPVVTMVMMAMVMRPPVVMVVMMTMRSPVVVVVMMRPPMVMMVVAPLHVGRQLAGVALRGGGDARTDRRCRQRLLRGSRDNQKRTEGGKS